MNQYDNDGIFLSNEKDDAFNIRDNQTDKNLLKIIRELSSPQYHTKFFI